MKKFICRVFHFKHWIWHEYHGLAECNKCGWWHRIGK
jgi:hypothetical protein